MPFEIEGTVALISGEASGIGLQYAKALLRNGLKGVTLADISNDFGEKALQEIESEFGARKAIFVKTDVTNKDSYEDAFKKTIDTFKNLDIVINNAGILNDSIWEKQILININGTINGILLGLEHYIPKYKTRSEGVIVNISSIAGLEPFPSVPIYSATKRAVIGMSLSFGHEAHYKRTNVRILTLCPGITDTPFMEQLANKNLGPPYQKIIELGLPYAKFQPPEKVSSAIVKIIGAAKAGTIWVVEDSQEPYEYVMPPREQFAPK